MPCKDKQGRTYGFIDVEEKEKSSKFMRRFLRLNISVGVLEWFVDNPLNLPCDASPCNSIELNYITKVNIPQKTKLKARHSFIVNTPMRGYLFQASDNRDLNEWVETLDNASKIVVSDEEVVDKSKSDEEFSYKTEIVAGVIIQKEVAYAHDKGSIQVKNDQVPSSGRISTSSNTKISHTEKIKSGYAVKQGHVRKNWKRRYFVLTYSLFSYYKSDQEKDPIRCIPVSSILAAKVEKDYLSEHRDNLFFVATTDRIYYIQADSPQDMHQWISAFNDVVNFVRQAKLYQTAGGDHGTSIEEVPRRKLDKLTPVTPYTQRNSTQVVVEKSGSGAHILDTAHSPSRYFRLSTTEDSLPGSRRSDARRNSLRMFDDRQNVMNTSEESEGIGSSVDSLTVTHKESNISGSTSLKNDQKPRRIYKRSCSGSDIVVESIKIGVIQKEEVKIKSVDAKDESRHSYPSSKHKSVLVKQENIFCSSASFSHATNKVNVPDQVLSSQSFSAPKRNVQQSRSFLFDPKVDHRAAVKPSSVKKKRNPGILFSLNNMLNKKAEKMKKSAAKKGH